MSDPKIETVGLMLGEVKDIEKSLAEAKVAGFDFVCVNLLSQTYIENEVRGLGNDPEMPFSWLDMKMATDEWAESVHGILGDFQVEMESPDVDVRYRATQVLLKEMDYVQHLSLPSAIVNLHAGNSTNMTRLLVSKIMSLNDGRNHAQLWVRMPMTYEANDGNSVKGSSSWANWNQLRTAGIIRGRQTFVYAILDLQQELPDDNEIQRWLGEPVKALLIGAELFTFNSKGFPVMRNRHQKVLKSFLDIGAKVIIKAKPQAIPLFYERFRQYINYTYSSMVPDWENDPMRGYRCANYLLSPNEPLLNFDLSMLEMFVNHQTKYLLYQEAVAEAIKEKVPEMETVTMIVIGIRIGALIRHCVKAAEAVHKKVKVFAVEEDADALNILSVLKERMWGDRVIICPDTKGLKSSVKVDFLVTDLLSAFGNNQVSPKCLEETENFLKEGGVMIPQRYSYFVCPVMCPKLHLDVCSYIDQNQYRLKLLEAPLVVYLKNHYQIDEPKLLFKVDSKRFESGALEFTAKLDCVMHGFACYFRIELYGKTVMSIHPDDAISVETIYPNEMLDWSPLFLPIRDPVQIKKDDMIKATFWRCSNDRKIWNEWCVSSPIPTQIHNVHTQY